MDYIEIIRIRRRFIPYLTDDLKDQNTRNAILSYLKTLNQERLTISSYKKEVIVHISSFTKKEHLIAYRANMSALPKESIEELNHKSMKKGVRQAFGYDIHLTIALGLITEILESNLDHQFLFIFQSNNHDSINGLLKSKQMKQYQIDEIYSLQFDPELNANQLLISPGVRYSYCREIKIEITTRQNPFIKKHPELLKFEPVKRSTELIVKLQSLLKEITRENDVVLSFCNIQSTLLEEHSTKMVILEGTIRAFDSEVIKTLKVKIETVIEKLMNAYNSKIHISYGLYYPRVYNHEELAHTLNTYYSRKMEYQLVTKAPYLYGNDFGFYTNKFNGLLITIGIKSKYPLLENPTLLSNEIIIQKSLRLFHFYLIHRVNELGNHL
ncbi:zinc-binding metallopeptidase family protein [Haloplasma contractile]|uniref:Uncharacterized protein n=1 Tax=Haloplasma contractile SSD-17B TaxID=1033810 RepID=U2DSQ9_9MOLU|nr:acetyldiaminopimelate deacetylase [Haloplasma contractile]ERJ11527.1 hypothetical protein HLPCO_002439 [Haloplasma contractile SSD-17B]